MIRARPGIGWRAFVAFVVYFGLILFLALVPGFGASSLLLLLELTLVLVIPVLSLLALWGTAAFAISRVRKRPMGPRSRAIGQVATAGLAALAAFMALASVLPPRLPGGSYDRPFDRAAWLDPNSASHLPGDITPRQKMVADAVTKLPGLRRPAIEAMLGPALETAYFQSTGRDLIYPTGPQRDSLFGVDSEWLLIWLDENGVYRSHAIVTD